MATRDEVHRLVDVVPEARVAERLNITTVVTIDRRDFGIVRPARIPALTLLP